MIDLFSNKTYGALTNYGDRDDDGDDYRNEDINNNGNAASISGSDDPIFDMNTTPWYFG